MKNYFISLSIIFYLVIFFLSSIATSVKADWFKISSAPIIATGLDGSWDQKRVGSMSVFFDGYIFKMWYEGYDGLNWRIGYATSSNGLSWNKYPSFVVDILDNRNNFNVHDPKVIFKNNKFWMWYAASDSFINNIHVNFTESTNSVTWSPSLINVLLPSLTWENDISFPYTIFADTKYKMWYAARGNYSRPGNSWRIGYATSADGLTWTKHPDPVLWAQDPWEGWDVANPSVLYDENTGVYEMFYHGDHGIGRATSPDGIHWAKDSTNPILTSTPGTFDSERVFNPYVLKKDSIYYMWYTGVNNQGKWQIGLATSEPIPTPGPTSTPANTPTPAPTATMTPTPLPATPTSTPSPTTTPAQTSPVVFIPGLGASWNPQDIFSCSIDSSGNWEMAPYVSIYNRLIKTLTENAGLKLNHDLYIYTYDWRQPLDKQSANFQKYLDKILENHPPDTKLRLVGHSLGGLVARSYLADNSNPTHIASVLTVGTPHLGTAVSYPIWEKGEISSDDFILQIAMTQVVNHCRIIRTFLPPKNKAIPVMKFRTSREIIHYLTPVIKELLPVFDYLKQDNRIKPVSELMEKNDWLPTHPFPTDNFGVDFRTLSGNGKSTLRYFDVVNPTLRETILGDWADGKPVASKKINEGDGIVLTQSSQINTVNNEIINGDHGDIVAQTEGIQKILHFLGLPSVAPAAPMAIPEETSQTILSISTDTEVKLNLTDPRGKRVAARENMIVSFDPSAGLYSLEISGEKASAYLHLSQIARNKETKTQSYSVSLDRYRPSEFYIIYNSSNPDPINLIPL